MRVRRLVLIPAVACAAVFAFAAPAAANNPPENTATVGWSQDWHFTDANNFVFTMTIPGGVEVTGTGYDTDDVRYFEGTVTDTTPDPDACAWLDFTEDGGEQTWIACNGSVSFTQFDPTPHDYTFSLMMRNANNTWRQAMGMVIPTTKGYPAMRAAGNGVHWSYVTPTQVNYTIVRPGAAVNGYANAGVPSRTTTATIYSATCTNNTVTGEYQAVLATANGVCASSSPGTVSASGIEHYFRVVNFLQIRIHGGNPRCVEADVR